MANNEIKQYWNERAAASTGSVTATTDDVHMRELEIATLIRVLTSLGLPADARLLDVGCGDGYSTLRIAQALSTLSVVGVDYAAQMVANAAARLREEPGLRTRVKFGQGDVADLAGGLAGEKFDVVITDRCLINLVSPDDQARAFAEIAGCLKPRGHYVAIENFMDGQNNMNSAREAVGLPAIPIRWHNRFFSVDEFQRMAKPYFKNVVFEDFASSYYLATRVVYSSMCQMRGEPIDYDHAIHRLAVRLPPTGQFSPIRLAILST